MRLQLPHRRFRDRDLTALADGTLPARCRARVERALAADPQLRASLDAQRLALAAIRELAAQPAPTALRARVALARDPHRRLPRRVGALSTAAAVTASAAVLALSGGATPAPSVADAAALATRPAMATAPAPRGENATLPRLRAAGLPFPYWEDRFGFTATGMRHDRLDGRVATTVFYDRAGSRVAYTILSGPPLPTRAAAPSTIENGVKLRSSAIGGRMVVTWLRHGHTCVLSGARVPLAMLVGLASWRGGGQIPY